MTELITRYRTLRSQGWRASQALSAARTLERWEDNDGAIVEDYCDSDEPGTVRLLISADNDVYDDSYFDTWDDITESQLERLRSELWARVEREGVYGVIGEYWDGHAWCEVDSCWSFIGDDWLNSGYDHDIMRATLDAYSDHLDSEARALEVTRPDMYEVTQ